MPESIQFSDFGAASHGLTGFFYFLLPMFDVFCGGLGSLSLRSNAEVFAEILDLVLAPGNAASIAAINVEANYRAQADNKSITAAWIDLLTAMVGGVANWGSLMVAGVPEGALVGGTLVAAAALELLVATFAVSGTVFALANFSVAIRYHLRYPMLVRVPVPLKEPGYDVDFSITQDFGISWISLQGTGHAAVTTIDRNGRRDVRVRSDGDFVQVKTLGPGQPTYQGQRRVFLNRDGDLAWEDRIDTGARLENGVFYQPFGAPRVTVHQGLVGGLVCGLLDQREGETLLYGVLQRGGVLGELGFNYSTLNGPGSMDLRALASAPQDAMIDFRINQQGKAIVVFSAAGGFYRQMIYQAPIFDQQESIELVGSEAVFPYHALGINARGDFAFADDINSLWIQRGGQAGLTKPAVDPEIRRIHDLAINDHADVFVSGITEQGDSLLIKYPSQGEPVRLTPFLPAEFSGYGISKIAAAGDYVAVGLTRVDGNAHAFVLLKARL